MDRANDTTECEMTAKEAEEVRRIARKALIECGYPTVAVFGENVRYVDGDGDAYLCDPEVVGDYIRDEIRHRLGDALGSYPSEAYLALAAGADARDVARVCRDTLAARSVMGEAMRSEDTRLTLVKINPSDFTPDELAELMEHDLAHALAWADDKTLDEVEEVMGHEPPFDVYADARRLYNSVCDRAVSTDTLSPVDRALVSLMWDCEDALTEPMLAAWRDGDLDALTKMLADEATVFMNDAYYLSKWAESHPEHGDDVGVEVADCGMDYKDGRGNEPSHDR